MTLSKKSTAKTFHGMTYREVQKWLKEQFKQLSKEEQQQLRNQGYYCVGWDRVKRSYELIQNHNNNNVIQLDKFRKDNDQPSSIEVGTATIIPMERGWAYYQAKLDAAVDREAPMSEIYKLRDLALAALKRESAQAMREQEETRKERENARKERVEKHAAGKARVAAILSM